jgi:hypothetical protein
MLLILGFVGTIAGALTWRLGLTPTALRIGIGITAICGILLILVLGFFVAWGSDSPH